MLIYKDEDKIYKLSDLILELDKIKELKELDTQHHIQEI